MGRGLSQEAWEQRSGQKREKQVHRPQEGAVSRTQDLGNEEEHSLGKGPGCTPHLSPRSPQGSKHPDSTDPFNICHHRKEGPKCPELATLCPDGPVQSLMVSHPLQGSCGLAHQDGRGSEQISKAL